MIIKKATLMLAVAGMALICGSACAHGVTFRIPGTSKAWDNQVNPDYPIGIDDGSAPAVAEGLSLKAGEKIHITATGGTQTFPGAP